MEKTQKMVQKHTLQRKSSCNILKSVSNTDLIFVGVETPPMDLLRSDYQIPNSPNAQNSLTFSQYLSILAFLKLFSPTTLVRPKINQHHSVDQNFGECSLCLKVTESTAELLT